MIRVVLRIDPDAKKVEIIVKKSHRSTYHSKLRASTDVLNPETTAAIHQLPPRVLFVRLFGELCSRSLLAVSVEKPTYERRLLTPPRAYT